MAASDPKRFDPFALLDARGEADLPLWCCMTDLIHPTGLERLEDRRIRMRWSDGSARVYTPRELRDHCPCAGCREMHGPRPQSPFELTVLSPAELLPLGIESMRPVGTYAYAIRFTDGHSNGIFTFELLRSLGTDEGQGG